MGAIPNKVHAMPIETATAMDRTWLFEFSISFFRVTLKKPEEKGYVL
jgi:hypothetical protein